MSRNQTCGDHSVSIEQRRLTHSRLRVTLWWNISSLCRIKTINGRKHEGLKWKVTRSSSLFDVSLNDVRCWFYSWSWIFVSSFRAPEWAHRTPPSFRIVFISSRLFFWSSTLVFVSNVFTPKCLQDSVTLSVRLWSQEGGTRRRCGVFTKLRLDEQL